MVRKYKCIMHSWLKSFRRLHGKKLEKLKVCKCGATIIIERGTSK